MSDVLTYDQLLDYIIDGGIAEVKEEYQEPKDHHKRDGAIAGFEACRGKTPEQIIELWTQACARSRELMHAEATAEEFTEYWRARYYDLQIEWVLNVLSIALDRPLLGHLPTLRGAQRYARILAQHMGVLQS